MRLNLLCAVFVIYAPFAAAQETAVQGTPTSAPPSTAEGLAAWGAVFAAASHPRCTNCHVGAQGRPMWDGLGYGENVPHGMYVHADESRIGAETIPCRTCHISSAGANDVPRAAPQIDDAWRLPPIELEWAGKSSVEICKQMRDPDTNDDNSIAELAEHVLTSSFVSWGFQPGGGRDAPAGSVETLAEDILKWGAAGTPCVGD